jgi:hypothetical protein
MANYYLTQDDVNNYGHELIDVTQRAALHAVGPALEGLAQQNEELRQRLAVEARRNLDQRVAAAVPNYQAIDRDPRWHRWLLQVDPLSGHPRQLLLNDAIASGSDARIAAFFRGFQQAAGDSPSSASAGAAPGRTRSASSTRGRTYSRDEVAKLYDQHRRGAYAGREAEWAKLEVDIIRAGAEGRIQNPVDIHGK